MLYQAVQQDRPPLLDGNNVADLKHLGSSYVGVGVRAVFQPDQRTWGIDPGDVFLLAAIANMPQLQGLVYSTRVETSFGGEAGSTKTVTGSIVDANLDPFGSFAAHI
jgi:hypothetical protein